MSILQICLCLVTLHVPADTPTKVHNGVWHVLREGRDSAKVWVFFTDKGPASAEARSAALLDLQQSYVPRAIERRRLRRSRPGLFDEQDLPPSPSYVRQITGLGAEVVVESRWLNAVSARVSAAQVRAIAALPFVRGVEPVRRAQRAAVVPISGRRPARMHERRAQGGIYGLSEVQLAQIGVTNMHAAGYDGSGVIIGVLDTGFHRAHAAFSHADHPIEVVAEWDFVSNDGNAGWEPGDPEIPDPHGTIYQHYHGTSVLGTIAAYAPNDLLGGAYGASFILAKTEDVSQEVPAEEDLYAAGLEFIEANGGDVATSSLGYSAWYEWEDLDGLTAVTTIAVNAATANGLICCTAAGNGAQDSDLPTLIAPGDAFDVITCGAADAAGNLADFSSIGPTFDGRIKPEVLALGLFTATIDPLDDSGYVQEDGTSMSTPLVASAVALLLQAHPNWSPDQLRTALFETADYFVANGEPDPLSYVGYGVINVFAASQVSFCVADLDGSGVVDSGDLATLLGAWGPNPDHPADLDGDAIVGANDLALLLGSWGACG